MAKLFINAEAKKGKINKEIYGHFSEHLGRCIYEGLYVGEASNIPNVNGMRTDVIEALKEMKIPVLRWPGGCFADEYHWKDGIGPKENRKKMVNTHWGGVVEDNSFGTHEFMELCSQLGCETYINGNVGSGTVQEMSEWVEYMTFEGVSPMAKLREENGSKETFPVNFFGVGNENWGCGGNMRPQHYADEYRRYQTYVRNYNTEKKIYKIACGPNVDDYEWTKQVMEIAGNFMDGLSLHYYTLPNDTWDHKGSATEFSVEEYYTTLKKTLKMEELIHLHGAIMDQYDPEKKVGLIVDEWGTWYDVEPGTNPGFLYQQNTMRDALVAAINLNIFNENCDRVKMANIAQLVNVLQSVILTEGAKMVLTPTYHVFEMYKHHQDGTLLSSDLVCDGIETDLGEVPTVTKSVSVDADHVMHITLGNTSADKPEAVDVTLTGAAFSDVRAEMICGEIHDKNTFEKIAVEKNILDTISNTENLLSIELPACSVVHVSARLK